MRKTTTLLCAVIAIALAGCGQRIKFDEAAVEVVEVSEEATATWFAAYHAQMEFLKTAERAPIGLAHDGETFNDDDLEGFLATLLMLREAGYRFPDHMLEMVRDEIAAGGGGDED